jgi:hypothetical protein
MFAFQSIKVGRFFRLVLSGKGHPTLATAAAQLPAHLRGECRPSDLLAWGSLPAADGKVLLFRSPDLWSSSARQAMTQRLL